MKNSSVNISLFAVKMRQLKTKNMTIKQKKDKEMMLLQIKNIKSTIRDLNNTECFLVGLYLEANAKFKNGDTVMKKEDGDKKTYRIIQPYFSSDTICYYANGNFSQERFEEDEIKLVKNSKH